VAVVRVARQRRGMGRQNARLTLQFKTLEVLHDRPFRAAVRPTRSGSSAGDRLKLFSSF
jgi:hypothetical protein